MIEFANLPDAEREIYFQETAERSRLPAHLVEKDFWVCYTLRLLFSDAEIARYLTFKGGTSLSKVYKAIDRFSEDIDFAVSRGSLGFTGAAAPDAVNETEVIIGSVNKIAGRLWNLHEFGGVATKLRKLKPHRFRVGEHGPIRIKQLGNKTKFARIELRTAAQANRATRLVAEENERRSDNKFRHYPKRPFMTPALEANRCRLPTFWANSVK